MNTTLPQYIDSLWKDDLQCLIFDDGDLQLTRQGFLRRVSSRQQQLSGGLKAGDKVVVQAGRSVQFFIDLYAVWAMGGVVVPVAADVCSEYIEHVMSIAEPALVLGEECTTDTPVYGTPTSISDADVVYVDGSPDTMAAILFTSGSTGVPKGVVLSHRVLVGNSLGILSVLKMKNERLLINIPFSFTSGICHFLACALSGSALLGLETKLLLGDLPRKIAALKATGFGGAPIQLRWIAEAYQGKVEAGVETGMQLRFVMSSGDHFSADIIESFMLYAKGLKLFTVYGLTELGGRYCVLTPDDLPARMGSVGKPIPGLSVSIRDTDSGEVLGLGNEGEVVANGAFLCDGYYRNPGKTEELLTPEGLRTGDIGFCDEDGFLYLKGRLDDVFKVSGQKVSAVVIAEAMMKLGYFQDVAVISAPSSLFDNVPVAFCVLKKGVEFKKGVVLSLLRKVLPGNHMPDRFVMIGKIPRTGSGKAKRHELKVMLDG